MYDKTELQRLVTALSERVYKIRPAILDTSLYGGSNLELQKQELQRTSADLVHGIKSGWERQAITEQAKRLEGQLQTAAAIGLIGDKDLQEYLGMTDDIYAALDQEN